MYNQISKMQDLPAETPYEKCYRYGVEALSDAELLAIIIRSGTRGRNAIKVAHDVICQQPDGLLNLIYLELSELQKIPGIGPVKALELKVVAELSMRISKSSRFKSVMLCDAASVAGYYMEQLRHRKKEHLIISMFDVKCKLLGDEIISVGTVDSTILSPREIFMSALKQEASFIIILHNHPSGIPFPSKEDQQVTSRINQCGTMLGVPLIDHIIIGDNSYFSFKEKGLI